MKSLTVTIVIPNLNGAHLLAKNLPSVLKAARAAQVVVVDDGSTDGSVGLLKEQFPQVEIVSHKKQLGFASSVNSGVAKALGDIVILLNTDVSPHEDFLAPLLSHFRDNQVFAVGCLERSFEKEGVIQRGRGEARWVKGFYIHNKGEVDGKDTAWASGGSAAFRRDLWLRLGGMDRIFNPFYWEDIDLSYRARKAGYKVLFERKSVVDHQHETGTIRTTVSPSYIRRVAYRNQYIFIWKNLSDPLIFVSHVFWNKIGLLKAMFTGDWAMFAGFFWAISLLPVIVKSRFRAAKYWRLPDKALS